MRKTPFQKHREEEEKRKKREEEEAAKVYEDFVESFGDKAEDGDESQSFVQGGTIQPGSAPSAPITGLSSGIKKASTKYVPSFMPPAMAAAVGNREDKEAARVAEESAIPLPTRADRGKTRNIDKMLETMKRDQEMRSERQRARAERGSSFGAPGAAIDDGLGSFDDGDPFTTNLYVGNLAPDVDEEVLKREFLRYGDVASIKVMWPRDDDQRRRNRNCGFVAFMTRHGAEQAKDELNGAILHDLDLKIGWGKAIVLPPIPMYTSSGTGGLAPMMAAARAIAQAPPPGQAAIAPWSSGQEKEPEDPHKGNGPDIVVKPPEDARVCFIIDSVACYVMADGCALEQVLMSREAENPEFIFLFDLDSPEHAYYRWRLYSLVQGDSLRNWRNEPFVMVEGGPRWIPPSMTALGKGRQQTAAQRGGEAKDKDKPLSDLQRDRFEDILRALTLERANIRDAMVFALDNADSAFEIVETLTDSLTLPETPLPTKVSRLMLASDVLHNSTAQVRNASRYRNLLEASLPDVFESLQDTYRGLGSRMEQETLRRHVLRLLRIWRSWFIFSDDYLNGLQATFLKGKTSDAKNTELRNELEALDLDSLATRCRRNGLSREGDKETRIQRLINLQAYLSGDVKAEPLAPTAAVKEEPLQSKMPAASNGVFAINAQPSEVKEEPPVKVEESKAPVKVEAKASPKEVAGPVSKWTLVDSDNEAYLEPEDQQDGNIFSDVETTPVVNSGTAPELLESPARPSGLQEARGEGPLEAAEKPETRTGGERMDAAEEGRRARLRQVEVEVLLFREGLEDKGLSKEEIEAKVEDQRKKLLIKAEKKPSAGQPSTSERDAVGDRRKESKKESRKDKKDASKQERSASPAEERKRDRSKAPKASKDREKEHEKDKDRKDKRGKEVEKRRSRSRSRDRHYRSRSRSRSRDARPRRRSRSRSRSRGRDRDKRADRSRSREQHREDDGRGRRKDSRRSRSRDRHGRRSRSRDAGARKRDRSRSKGAETRHAKREDAGKKSSKRDVREGSRSRSPKRSKNSRDSKRS